MFSVLQRNWLMDFVSVPSVARESMAGNGGTYGMKNLSAKIARRKPNLTTT